MLKERKKISLSMDGNLWYKFMNFCRNEKGIIPSRLIEYWIANFLKEVEKNKNIIQVNYKPPNPFREDEEEFIDND
jgi:G:T-mismatch repair DNA endonuclease (very short patch repair protein)